MASHILDRRTFALGLSLAAIGSSSLAGRLPRSGRTRGPSFVHIGTHGDQIHSARFDTQTGRLEPVEAAVQAPSTNWIVPHPRLPLLYAASGTQNGLIYRLHQDPEHGTLTKLDEISAGTGGLSYLCLETVSETLLTSNYAGSQVIGIPIMPDGTTPAISGAIATQGSGPNPRQKNAHPHCVAVAPGGHHVLVPDLGADRVFIIGFDRQQRRLLAPADGVLPSLALPAGSGPRHVAFHPFGRFAYLINELTAVLTVMGWDARTATLTAIQNVPTTPADFAGTLSAAELAVSADGRFVYTSNRGDHTIVVHAVDQQTGMVRQTQKIACGGQSPWAFAIHPTGQWMLVANDGSSTVDVFHIDIAEGRLAATGVSWPVPHPACVTFA